MVSKSFEEHRRSSKICNDLPQKGVARTVQNFHNYLQSLTEHCMGHFLDQVYVGCPNSIVLFVRSFNGLGSWLA